MKFRKGFSLILVMAMLMSLLAGCSNAEWGLYNLSQEINDLEKYETTGEMGITLDYINPELAGTSSEMISQIQSVLNEYSLTFNAEADVKASKLVFTYYFKNKNTGEQKEIMHLQSDGDTLYIKVDDLFNFMKSFGNEELNTGIDQIFANVQYISIGKEEMKELLLKAYMGNEELAELVTQVYFDFGTFYEQNKSWQGLFEGLIKDVYDDYEMGIVKEDKNKYTVSLSLEGMVDVLASFANYSIDHIEELGSYLTTSVNDLNDSQKQLLGLYDMEVDNIDEEINTWVEMIKTDKDTFKSQIDLMISYAKNPEIKKAWEGTQLDYFFEKTDDDVYKTGYNGTVSYIDPITKANMFKVSFVINQTVKEIDSVSITTPTENVLTIKELMKITEAFEPVAMDTPELETLYINLNNGYYLLGYEEGTINVKVIESTSYLPLREVGDLLGKTIYWDSEKKQPYVELEQGAAKVYLEAKVLDGTSYIPSREFEKVGYRVEWDAVNNIVSFQ